jgi:hypothetical protein
MYAHALNTLPPPHDVNSDTLVVVFSLTYIPVLMLCCC